MDEQPGYPCGKPAELHAAALSDRSRPPDGGHHALVEVLERLRRLSRDLPLDLPGDEPPLLHRHLRHPWQRSFTPLRDKVRDIPDHAHLGVALHAAVLLDLDPPARACFRADTSCEAARAHASAPNHRARAEPFVTQ